MSSIKLIYIAICYSLCYSICYNLSTVSAASHTDKDKAQASKADEGNMLVSELIGLGINLVTTKNDELTATAYKTNILPVELVSTKDTNREKVLKFVNEELNTNFKSSVPQTLPKNNISPSTVPKSSANRLTREEIEQFFTSYTVNHLGYKNSTMPLLKTKDPENKVIRLENVFDIYNGTSHQIEIEMRREEAYNFIECVMELRNNIVNYMALSDDITTAIEVSGVFATKLFYIIEQYEPEIVSACLDRDTSNINGYPIAIKELLSMIVGNYLSAVGSRHEQAELIEMMNFMKNSIDGLSRGEPDIFLDILRCHRY